MIRWCECGHFVAIPRIFEEEKLDFGRDLLRRRVDGWSRVHDQATMLPHNVVRESTVPEPAIGTTPIRSLIW